MTQSRRNLSRRQFLGSAALGSLAAFGSTAALSCRGGSLPAVDCEVAIVGSGFAGTYLALRLAKLGIDTVIVEAGTESASKQFKTGFRGKNLGGVWYPIDVVRHIGVGGTSQKWTGVVCRLLPEDFRLRSTYGVGADWPITYDDLVTHYCEAETLLHSVGHPPIPNVEPPRDCVYPYESPAAPYAHGATIAGIQPEFAIMALSKRDGTGEPIRLDKAETESFQAFTHGRMFSRRQVTRILTEADRVIGIETQSTFDPPLLIRAQHYVLAAGPFECARLLLQSANDEHPEGIANENGLVGRHFNAHPAIMRKVASAKAASLAPGAHRTYSLQDAWRREGLNACAFQVLNENDGTAEWRAVPEIEASAENRVTLSNAGTDLFGIPHTALDFNYSDRDHATLQRSREVLNEMEDRFADAPRTAEETVNWRSHPAGTMRMAATAAEGVVDPNNKIFGMQNLFISGASVFPNSGTPNPTLTVTAMTLRLADHLARQAFGKNP